MLWRSSEHFLRNTSGFRKLAFDELPKHFRRRLVRKAAHLAEGISAEHFRVWGASGIRAQILDIRSKELVMDFYFEGDDRSFHVLNALSPGFTCGFPFVSFLVDEIQRRGVSPTDLGAGNGNDPRGVRPCGAVYATAVAIKVSVLSKAASILAYADSNSGVLR